MSSSYEKIAYKTLNNLWIRYKKETRVVGWRYRIDIMITSYSILRLWKLCIEIDWEYHKWIKDIFKDLFRLRILEATKSLITFIQDRIRDELTYLCWYKVIRTNYKKNIKREIEKIIYKEILYYYLKLTVIVTVLLRLGLTVD